MFGSQHVKQLVILNKYLLHLINLCSQKSVKSSQIWQGIDIRYTDKVFDIFITCRQRVTLLDIKTHSMNITSKNVMVCKDTTRIEIKQRYVLEEMTYLDPFLIL